MTEISYFVPEHLFTALPKYQIIAEVKERFATAMKIHNVSCGCTHEAIQHSLTTHWTPDPAMVGQKVYIQPTHCRMPECRCPGFEDDNLLYLIAYKRKYPSRCK